MNKPAAIYARVSSDRQKENHTIASQTAALIEYAQKNGFSVPPEWVFQDEGYSGAILVRPGLEALRDLAAEGQIAPVLVYSPDRLSRKYAYQVLLSEELARCGMELVFLRAPAGVTPCLDTRDCVAYPASCTRGMAGVRLRCGSNPSELRDDPKSDAGARFPVN